MERRPPPICRRPSLALLVLLGLGASFLPLRAATGDSGAGPAAGEKSNAQERAFRLLDSPVQEERRSGVESLVALLPDVRPQVIKALPKAAWGTQIQLIEVLTRDGTPASVRALLDHLMSTDETQAVRIRMNLARDRKAAARLLAQFRADPRAFLSLGGPKGSDAKGLRRLMDLLGILRRGEIEEKFLSRKSKSGSTGYYRGQYDLLKDPALGETYRTQSLDIVMGIALNEAVEIPGVYRSGAYRFLRPHFIDEVEFVGMALNAVAELCSVEDTRIIRRLEQRLIMLDRKRRRLYIRLGEIYGGGEWGQRFDLAMQDWEDALSEYGDVLACLAIIQPDAYDRSVTLFIRELRSYDGVRRPRSPLAMIAGILIRVGRYREAIEAYQTYLDYDLGSAVLSHYNLACAWASYSRVEGASAMETAFRKERALEELSSSVARGWSDVGWMSQDRDLDPIRDTATYRALVLQIEESFKLPEEQGEGR